TQTLADCHVGNGKSLMNTGFRGDHVSHAIVFETDHRVGGFVQARERIPGLGSATFPFKSKWQRREPNDERAHFARDLRDHGAAPEPVPPPNPVQMKIRRASASAWRISSADSCAASKPSSGSPPVPRPRVTERPSCTLTAATELASDWTSVLAAMRSDLSIPSSTTRSSAFEPALPTAITLIGMIWSSRSG